MSNFVDVDLSRFTNLDEANLYFREDESLEQKLRLLKDTLSGISSHSISNLFIKFEFGWEKDKATDLDSTIVQLAALKEVDAILASPQFRGLRGVKFIFWSRIQYDPVKSLPIAPDASLSTFALNPESRTESASQPSLSEDTSTLTPYDLKQHAQSVRNTQEP